MFNSGGSGPWDIAVTRSQPPHLVVVHNYSSSLTVLSLSNGHVVRTIRRIGNAQGQLHIPLGVCVCVDPQQGHLWVADNDNNRIQVFDEQGYFVRQFPCIQDPSSVAFLSTGDIVVASLSDKRLHVYSPEGALRRSFGAFGRPWQVAVVLTKGTENHLAVADYYKKCIQFVSSTDGHVIRTLATESGPQGVVVTPDGYVLVVETGRDRVVVFSPQGEHVHQWGSNGSAPGQFYFPRSGALLPDGRVVIADSGNNRIQLF